MEYGFNPGLNYSSNSQDLYFSLTKDKGYKTKVEIFLREHGFGTYSRQQSAQKINNLFHFLDIMHSEN